MKYKHLFTFGSVMIVAWVLGTFAFIYFYPHLNLNNFKNLFTFISVIIVAWVLGTFAFIYFCPQLMLYELKRVITRHGVDANTSSGIPINTLDGADFAYVGTRTTGTQAGDYLITGLGWKGQVQSGMTQISSPNNSVLVIGRVLVQSDSDLSTAYDLSKQIHPTPLSHWQPGQ